MVPEPVDPYGAGIPAGGNARLEERLRKYAAAFPYPETPDLAAREAGRLPEWKAAHRPLRRLRLAPALAVLLVALAAVLLVSPVRARVLEWIRIGSVRIFFNQPSPTAPVPAGAAGPAVPTHEPGLAAAPAATPTFIESVLDLDGETSLVEAQEQVGFTIQLPALPPVQRPPDHVYLQEFENPVLMLVWMDPDQSGQVLMALSETLSGDPVFEKYDPNSVLDTQVHGQPAVWVEGDYLLVTRSGETAFTRLVNQSHTLIWTSGELTYRLETDADLDEAIRIAESIQ